MDPTGCCRYCGQLRMIDITEDMKNDFPEQVREFREAETEEQETAAADQLAALTCKCREGRDFREYFRKIRDCTDKIEAMFRENYPEIADALQETKGAVIGGDIARIQITDTMTGGTATMFMKKERLKIRWKKPMEVEIEAG